MSQLTNERRFLWVHLVLQIILDECRSPFEVEEAVERLPPGLEAIYSHCLARKSADRLLCDMNLLLWVCAAPEPPGIDALQELLAMDLETGQVSTGDLRAETYLLQSGVGLVTVEIANKVILPVHSTARKFVFSQSARRQFELMSTEANAKESWPLCIKAALWSERTFRSALGSLCLSQIELGTSLEVATRPKPASILMLQRKIHKPLRVLMGLKGTQKAAEISFNPSLFKHPARQTSAKVSLQYAIDNWLNCNRIIASDGVAFPWMAQINQRTSVQTHQQLFERVAVRRNDSFGVHPWPSIRSSLNSHILSMFAYAVANDHVPLMQVVKRNRKSLPSDVFDRPLPKHGEMLAIHVATRKGFTGIIDELLDICYVSKICRSTGENILHFAAKTGEIGHSTAFLAISAVNASLQDNSGRTPLHLAALQGNEAVVKAMLETARVEVNLTDEHGQTPLHWAARYGDEAVMKAMLETARVEVNLTDEYGQTPLHWAAKQGSEAVVKAMLETARVEVNLADKYGQTPLHWAATLGKEAAVKVLLETARVEVNLADKDGRTPLHWAAKQGIEAVVKAMLETARVEVNLTDEEGQTARDLAIAAGYKKVAKLIRR
jgi:ankyrin repeat protein